MTDWDKFRESPWGKDHRVFGKADLAIHPAPEYASSEVMLAATYRHIGFSAVKEKDVPTNGRELLKRVESGRVPESASLHAEDWSRVLQGSLQSPKLPNQSRKRFLQLTPVVPEIARSSGSARLAGNPWSPGSMVERMVLMGASSHDEARTVWRHLFDSLSVTESDDIWARWLERELIAWRKPGIDPWGFEELTAPWPAEFAGDAREVRFPARQFVKDLTAVIRVKDQMTRRQWTSLVESIVRMAAAAHLMWLCDVCNRGWQQVRSQLLSPDSETSFENIYPTDIGYFRYGSAALDRAKETVSRYLHARLGLNAVLWALEDVGVCIEEPLSSRESWVKLARAIKLNQSRLAALGVLECLNDMGESEARTLNCSKGIGMNMLEFVRHAAGQRQTAQEVLRGYDQGYSLRKRSHDKNSRWIVAMGPVAVIAMVHCCLFETGGARSVKRLCDHLARYGILIGSDEVATSDLGQKLRILGLVLDSPDAESGMLVLPPFRAGNDAIAGAQQ